MGNEVEARAQRVRNHLQRPNHPDRPPINAKVGSTVNRTVPDGITGTGVVQERGRPRPLLYPATDIAVVPEFVVKPRSLTALLDAVGRFITEVGVHLAAMPEDQRPGQVLCLIMTDGMENASHEWTWEAVKALITQQREIYGWQFVFLGADIDAVEVGQRIGVHASRSMTYSKYSYAGNRSAYRKTSEAFTLARSSKMAAPGFSEEDRAEAMGETP